MSDFLIEVAEIVSGREFWIGVAEIIVGVFSLTMLIALSEWYRTTKRLKKYVKKYIESGEFEWRNKTPEFAVMHRVRAFEILLRKVEALQPRTPKAYRRVEEVRDVLEEFHRGMIPIFKEEHLPLPRIGEFPMTPSDVSETFVRNRVLEGLRAIKWLRLEKPTGQ